MSTPLEVEKPIIKILIYTDDPRITETNRFGELFGLGSMLSRMHAHAPAFANLSHKLVSRNPRRGPHNHLRITDVLAQEILETGEPFDEIWFFGLHQANLETFSLRTFLGGPKSELFEDEVDALAAWMKISADGSGGGGVLMTGDHSNPLFGRLGPSSFERCSGDSANSEFLGLGRAIGRCVPRAGQLRRWEGSPTTRDGDRFSTISNAGIEADLIPQPLVLESLNADGDPDPNGQPHPLFLYKSNQFIRVFPDHVHEGAVVLPTDQQLKDTDLWPIGQNGQTRPRVVAFGTNSLNRELLNIIATYNGDLCERGRIVADSTWHHYFNLNLRAFPHPAPEGTDSDKIGQFYANLAVWLAPRQKRIQMAQAMAWTLADYTWILERYEDALRLGMTAEDILLKVASACEIHEVLQALSMGQPSEIQSLTAQVAGVSPSRSQVLGNVMKSYHEAAVAEEVSSASLQPTSVQDVIDRGLRQAFEAHTDELRQMLGVFNPNRDTSLGKETTMECPPERTWNIDTIVDGQRTPVLLTFCLDIPDDGHITGRVLQGETELSDVSGKYEKLTDTLAQMRLSFIWSAVNIVLSGIVIGPFPARFRGGFVAFTTGDSIGASVAPADGDTGTASGQQT